MNKIELNIEGLTKINNIASDLIQVKEREVESISPEDITKLFSLANQIKDKIHYVLYLDRSKSEDFLDDHIEQYR